MTAVETFRWDGLNARDAAAKLGLENVWLYAEVASTQDIAHEQAGKGVPAGALVVADAQRSGRGRQGRSWASQPGQGVWCTIVERPSDPAAFEVLSLRIGLRLASALDGFSPSPIRLKWPNDLLVGDSKLAGILTEARWNGSSLEWVAVGVGVNVTNPGVEGAAFLKPGVARFEVLRAVVKSVREAAAATGALRAGELQQFRERDWLAGKRILSPAPGVVEGVDATGALLVRGAQGVSAYRSGTIQLENGA